MAGQSHHLRGSEETTPLQFGQRMGNLCNLRNLQMFQSLRTSFSASCMRIEVTENETKHMETTNRKSGIKTMNSAVCTLHFGLNFRLNWLAISSYEILILHAKPARSCCSNQNFFCLRLLRPLRPPNSAEAWGFLTAGVSNKVSVEMTGLPSRNMQEKDGKSQSWPLLCWRDRALRHLHF